MNCPAWAGVSHLHRRSKPRLLIGQGLGLDALATFELGTFLRQEIGFWIGGFIACVLHSAEARTFLLHSCGLRSIYLFVPRLPLLLKAEAKWCQITKFPQLRTLTTRVWGSIRCTQLFCEVPDSINNFGRAVDFHLVPSPAKSRKIGDLQTWPKPPGQRHPITPNTCPVRSLQFVMAYNRFVSLFPILRYGSPSCPPALRRNDLQRA